MVGAQGQREGGEADKRTLSPEKANGPAAPERQSPGYFYLSLLTVRAWPPKVATACGNWLIMSHKLSALVTNSAGQAGAGWARREGRARSPLFEGARR